MTAGRRVVVALVLAAVSAAFVFAASGTEPTTVPATPLTNEDIVRMLAAGRSEAEVVAAIDARAEAFDVTDDMVDELTRAGVSAPILAAMKRKHGEVAPAAASPEVAGRRRVHLVVSLNAHAPGSRTLKTPSFAGEDLKVRLMLPKDNDQRAVKDLAVFLACVSAEHVPDLWRSKTPLGRDMVSVARHEMLAFIPGDTPPGQPPRLVVPPRIEADVDGDEEHDLVLGIAARIGDHWMQLSSARLAHVAIAPVSKPLTGRLEHVGHEFDFKVELTAPR